LVGDDFLGTNSAAENKLEKAPLTSLYIHLSTDLRVSMLSMCWSIKDDQMLWSSMAILFVVEFINDPCFAAYPFT
jgi:hypothetical protein